MSGRTSAAPRDLYLINGFWGETYRSWFTDRFLRSVLAPGNLAALDPPANNKILLATTEQAVVCGNTGARRRVPRRIGIGAGRHGSLGGGGA